MKRNILMFFTITSLVLVIAFGFSNSDSGGENQTSWETGQTVYVSYELSQELARKRSSVEIPKCAQPLAARAFPGERVVVTAINGELVDVRFRNGVELIECHWRWFSRDSRGFAQLTAENLTPYGLGQAVFLTYELAEKLDSPKAHGIRLQVVTIIGDRVSVRFDNDGVVLHDLEWQLLTKDAPYQLPSFWWSDPTL